MAVASLRTTDSGAAHAPVHVRHIPYPLGELTSRHEEPQVCALQTNQTCSTPLKLTSTIKLRGGGDSEAGSQPYGDDDNYMSTQAYGDNDDDEEASHLVRLVNGQLTGVAALLPDGIITDILALGRMDQAGQRESAVIGAEALTVATLLLEDSNKGRRPQVSCLQADIQLEDGILTFTTKGQSFSLINEIPFHAKVKKCMRSDRLYNGDLLRLGGGIDGKPPPGGNFSEFIYRIEAPALGERPPPSISIQGVAKAAAPSKPAAASVEGAAKAAATPNIEQPTPPRLIAALGNPNPDIALDPTPKARTLLRSNTDDAAHVVATRVGSFDLHSLHNTAISVSKGSAGSWVQLVAGRQMALRDGDRVSLVSGGKYMCKLPRPAAAAPAAATSSTVASGLPPTSHEAQAQELAVMATREAQIVGELTSGLQGKQLRVAQRNFLAAHDALVDVALGAAAEQDPVHAARVASNKLAKVANDGEKKRRREEVSHDCASAKAQRREDHRQPQGRAPGGPPKGHGSHAASAKRDRRTFEARTVARKARRVGDDVRRVEISANGRRGNGGRGSSERGKGKGGGKGSSKGGSKDSGKGGGKGGGKAAWGGGGKGKGNGSDWNH